MTTPLFPHAVRAGHTTPTEEPILTVDQWTAFVDSVPGRYPGWVLDLSQRILVHGERPFSNPSRKPARCLMEEVLRAATSFAGYVIVDGTPPSAGVSGSSPNLVWVDELSGEIYGLPHKDTP